MSTMGWRSGLMIALVIMVCGCGRGSGPVLVQVSGVVTVGDSEPFSGGIVRFTPRGKATTNAGGASLTDEDGSFVVLHQSAKKGIEPGEYSVSFSLFKMPDGSPMPDQSDEREPKSAYELGAVEFVPKEFSDVKSDKNIVTVTDEGGVFEFNIPELKKPKK